MVSPFTTLALVAALVAAILGSSGLAIVALLVALALEVVMGFVRGASDGLG